MERHFSLPIADYQGDGYTYHHHYEVLGVLDENAGPCITCDKPMVRLDVLQHVKHNEYEYAQRFDFVYAHADGSDHHEKAVNNVKPKCPECGAYGTLTTRQEAYCDRTWCSNQGCTYESVYMIGD